MEKQKILKPKGVIFDFDETLFFLSVDWEALKELLSSKFAVLGYFSSLTPLYPKIESILNSIQKDKGIAYSKQVSQEVNDIIRNVELEGAHRGKSALYSKEILEHLDLSKIAMGILSSNSEEVIRWVIKKYRWPSLMTIIGRESVAKLKPNILGVKMFLKKNGLESSEVWGVGNSIRDFDTYQKARLSKTIIISEKNISIEEPKMKFSNYKTLEQFYRWIKEN